MFVEYWWPRAMHQTPTYDTLATAWKQARAGMLAMARIPAATGTPVLSKGRQQERAQPQQQKRQTKLSDKFGWEKTTCICIVFSIMPPSPWSCHKAFNERKEFERRRGKLYKKYTDQQNNLLCQTFYTVNNNVWFNRIICIVKHSFKTK